MFRQAQTEFTCSSGKLKFRIRLHQLYKNEKKQKTTIILYQDLWDAFLVNDTLCSLSMIQVYQSPQDIHQ